MGKVVIHNQVTINGAFEAPTPEEWLELDLSIRSRRAALPAGGLKG